MASGEKTRFEVIFEGVGRSSGRMRNDVSVEWPMMKVRFTAPPEWAWTG